MNAVGWSTLEVQNTEGTIPPRRLARDPEGLQKGCRKVSRSVPNGFPKGSQSLISIRFKTDMQRVYLWDPGTRMQILLISYKCYWFATYLSARKVTYICYILCDICYRFSSICYIFTDSEYHTFATYSFNLLHIISPESGNSVSPDLLHMYEMWQIWYNKESSFQSPRLLHLSSICSIF